MSISSTIKEITKQAQKAVGQAAGSDSRFFQNTSKKGETHELREVNHLYYRPHWVIIFLSSQTECTTIGYGVLNM